MTEYWIASLIKNGFAKTYDEACAIVRRKVALQNADVFMTDADMQNYINTGAIPDYIVGSLYEKIFTMPGEDEVNAVMDKVDVGRQEQKEVAYGTFDKDGKPKQLR